jgi:hypothetical protein
MVTPSMAKTPNPRAKRICQENEALQVRSLRRHPYYDQIVKRIVAGESAQSIARWSELSANKADNVKNFTFYTWRLYISTLRQRIRPMLQDVEIKEPAPELYEALITQIRRDNDLPIEDDKPEVKPITRGIWASVKKAIRDIDAEKILKFAFLVQADRVEKLMEKEKSGQLKKDGYKEILALVAIGAALAKLEFGQHFMRAGKLHADSGTTSPKHIARKDPATSAQAGLDPDPFFWGRRDG